MATLPKATEEVKAGQTWACTADDGDAGITLVALVLEPSSLSRWRCLVLEWTNTPSWEGTTADFDVAVNVPGRLQWERIT